MSLSFLLQLRHAHSCSLVDQLLDTSHFLLTLDRSAPHMPACLCLGSAPDPPPVAPFQPMTANSLLSLDLLWLGVPYGPQAGCPPACCLQVCVTSPSGCSCTLLTSLPKTCLSQQQASDTSCPTDSLQLSLPGCLPNKGNSRWTREENNRDTPEDLLGGQELPKTQ